MKSWRTCSGWSPMAWGSLACALLLGGCHELPVPPLPVALGADYEACLDARFEEALRLAEAGSDEQACRLFEEVAGACPLAWRVRAAWVRVAMRAGGDLERRLRAFHEADTKGPIDPWVRSRIEKVDSRRVDLLERAVAADGSFHPAYLDLAEIWGRSDRTAIQLGYLEKAVSARPDFPEANLALGRLLVSIGRTEGAVSCYEAYLRAAPDDAGPTLEFVELLVYGLRDLDRAEPWIVRRLEVDPHDVEARMAAAALAWRRGDAERAAAGYRAVLEEDPREASAALNLGNLWFQRPDRSDAARDADWARARQAYRYFLALDPEGDFFDVHDVLVSVPYRIEVIDAAIGPLPVGAPIPGPADL
ncbi:MAG: tetratricopeptide repeat protein [Planctomycetota bacterium]